MTRPVPLWPTTCSLSLPGCSCQPAWKCTRLTREWSYFSFRPSLSLALEWDSSDANQIRTTPVGADAPPPSCHRNVSRSGGGRVPSSHYIMGAPCSRRNESSRGFRLQLCKLLFPRTRRRQANVASSDEGADSGHTVIIARIWVGLPAPERPRCGVQRM